MNEKDEITRLKAAAERAVAGYQHQEAIDYSTKALKLAPTGDDPGDLLLRYDLHFMRGESYEWIGQLSYNFV